MSVEKEGIKKKGKKEGEEDGLSPKSLQDAFH